MGVFTAVSNLGCIFFRILTSGLERCEDGGMGDILAQSSNGTHCDSTARSAAADARSHWMHVLMRPAAGCLHFPKCSLSSCAEGSPRRCRWGPQPTPTHSQSFQSTKGRPPPGCTPGLASFHLEERFEETLLPDGSLWHISQMIQTCHDVPLKTQNNSFMRPN